MKKKVKQQVEVEIDVCNICEKDITHLGYKQDRIAMVQHLFGTKDFDAHETCINGVVKEAFAKYFAPKEH